jgi:hypothetical protein
LDFFSNADFAELNNLTFGQGAASRNGFYQSYDQAVTGYQPALYNSVNNVQSNLLNITAQFTAGGSRGASASSISGLINLSPAPSVQAIIPVIQTRPFTSTATISTTMYTDVNRTGGPSNQTYYPGTGF